MFRFLNSLNVYLYVKIFLSSGIFVRFPFLNVTHKHRENFTWDYLTSQFWVHFLLFCNKYDTIKNSLVEDIISKYPEFDYLNANNKIVFLFNSTDAFICKKIRSLHLRSFFIKKWIIRYKNCKLTAFATLILYFFLLLFFFVFVFFFVFICNTISNWECK